MGVPGGGFVQVHNESKSSQPASLQGCESGWGLFPCGGRTITRNIKRHDRRVRFGMMLNLQVPRLFIFTAHGGRGGA